jgi:hypothetical protein
MHFQKEMLLLPKEKARIGAYASACPSFDEVTYRSI